MLNATKLIFLSVAAAFLMTSNPEEAKAFSCKRDCNRLSCRVKAMAENCMDNCDDDDIVNCYKGFESAEKARAKFSKIINQAQCATSCNAATCLNPLIALTCKSSDCDTSRCMKAFRATGIGKAFGR